MAAAEPLAPPRPAAPPVLAAAAFGGLTLLLFGPTLLRLVQLWEKDPNYSHGYLVAPIAAYLAWAVWKRVGPPRDGDRRLAVTGLVLGGGVHLVATLIGWPPLDFLAMFLVLRGGLLAAGGRAWAGHFTFPLLFLFFMFPLPVTWTGYAALWLQDVVARWSYEFLQLFAVCYRKGHNIYIAGVPEALVVAEECSGLRQLVSFVAFGALLGHLTRRPVAYQVLLVLAAVPVAVAVNILRVTIMNLGAMWFGTGWLDGPLHHMPAAFTIPAGLVLYLAANRLLGWVWGQPPAEPPAPAEPSAADPGVGPRLFVAAGVVAAAVVAHLALAAHLAGSGANSYPPLAAPLDALPREFAADEARTKGWVAKDIEGLDELRKKLAADQIDDLIYRAYAASPGLPPANVYAVYSTVGDDRKHHPEICLREVSGAPELLDLRAKVTLSAEGRQAQRFVFRPSTGELLTVYYWHYTMTPREDAVRSPLQKLHSRIGTPTPSLTVQVYTGATSGPDVAAIEKTLLPAIDAAVAARIAPPGTEVGSHRLPVALER